MLPRALISTVNHGMLPRALISTVNHGMLPLALNPNVNHELLSPRCVSTAEGKVFIISTPSMVDQYNPDTGYPRLVLMMLSTFNTSVRITTEKRVNKKRLVDETLTLDAMVSKHYSKPSLYYGPDTVDGYRWTFHLIGSMPFSLLVLMENSATSSETFTALPVAGWGKEYYVVTLETQISVVFMTNDYNTLWFTLNSVHENFALTVNTQSLRSGDSWKIFLLPFMSYAISTCGQLNTMGSVTGSSVRGERPFGIISGNCMAVTNFNTCPNGDDTEKTANSVVEMLPPLSTWGKIYILFKATGRSSPGHFIITSSSQYNTMVAFRVDHADVNDPYEVIYINPGQWAVKEGVYKWIHCAVSLQVVYIQSSSCLQENGTEGVNGAPSMMVVVPIELFHNFYICMIPAMEMKHYLMFVVQDEHAHTIRTLYSTRESPAMARVKGNHKPLNIIDHPGTWQIYEFQVNKNTTVIIYSLQTRFGCYVHGQSETSTYMHSPGYISSNINDKECVRNMASMVEGDLVDNDCDGLVDEEIRDGINNDGHINKDPYTDEDLQIIYNESNSMDDILRYHPSNMHESQIDFPQENLTASPNNSGMTVTVAPSQGNPDPAIQTNEMLTQWEEWKCTTNCSLRDMFRKRDCIPSTNGKGCTAALVEYKQATCHMKRCPDSCPPRHFGEECKKRCTFCTTDCDKFYGLCPACFPGFDFPEAGCQLVCEEYRWGINCRNSCINCLDDCNKYNGTCNRCMPFYRSPMDGCQTLIVDEWQSWECSRDCDIKQMLRERICHHSRPNCTTTEWKPGNCYVDSCPRDCPTLTWGVDCNNTCDNCETDCDKFNGSCSKCKPGYKNPKGGCHEECDRFSFGKDCKGNCKSKCDQDDCVDRKSGECPVHGKFGPWTPWYCTRNCMDPRMIRERFCNRPTPNTGGLLCTGPTQEWRDGSCYQPVDRLCPSDCPKFFWGVDCEQSCANCLDECDKFYGNCSRCKRGFKYPDRSCSKGCDRNEFGYDCKGSCAAKCGADCKERVHGYCKDPSSILVATIFGMFVAIPVVVYILKRNMLSGEKASQSED
ncbi:hypothetical protein Btru_014751 [Bulinus truncatus]|nr:hypothetical protein Btru_014751 [Bulinus truncatus]